MKIKEAQNISRDFANKLRELKEVKSISIYGSIAQGIFDKYSDVDIICFCDKIPNNKTRVKKILELKGVTERKKNWHLQDPFLYKGVPITVEYETLKDIQKYFKYILRKGKLDKSEESAKIRSHIINSIILYDRGNIIKKIKDKIDYFLKKLPNSSVRYFNYIKYHFWKIESNRSPIFMAVKRKNILLANQIINRTIEGIISCVYMLNEEYYYDPKWINYEIKKFKKKPKNFLKKINTIYGIKGNLWGINKKIKLITALLDEVEEIYKS